MKEKDQIKTLEEVGIEDGTVIKVLKKTDEVFPKADLITKDRKLTQKAQQAFSEIFNRFSLEGKMKAANMATFTQICLASNNVDENDPKILEVMNKYDKGSKGYISEEEFISFYTTSSLNREETVRDNLRKLGYTTDLIRFGLTKEIIVADIAKAQKLPRYILSNNHKFFDFLFALLRLGGEVADVTLHLIFRLTPSEECMGRVLNFIIEAKDPLDWSKLFPIEAPYESMYALFIAESMFGDASDQEVMEMKGEVPSEMRAKWITTFLEKGGFEWAISNVVNIKEMVKSEGTRHYAKALIDIIGTCFLANLQAYSTLPNTLKHYEFEKPKEKTEADYQGQFEVVEGDKPKAEAALKLKKIECTKSLTQEYLMNYQVLCGLLKEKPDLSALLKLNYMDLSVGLLLVTEYLLDPGNKLREIRGQLAIKIMLILKGIIIFKPEIYPLLKSQSNMQRILLSGAVYKEEIMIRDIFQQFIYFLAANVKIDRVSIPLFDFLTYMLDIKAILSETECAELCEVLILMIDMYKDESATAINIKEKFETMMNGLKNYNSKEVINKPEPDNVLLSIIIILEKLLTIPEIDRDMTPESRNKIIEEVFFSCLFPLKGSTESIYQYKCKTGKSREAAFNFINSLSKNESSSLSLLLQNCIIPLASQINGQLTTWSYEPERQEKSSSGFVGIKNLGSICYMNSMIQQFFMIPPFRNTILSIDDKKPLNLTKEGIDDNMLHQMQKIFGYLTFSVRKDFNPAQFCYAYKEPDGKPTNTNIQHDAHEFLGILFDRLENCFRNTPYNLLMQNIFGGKSCSQVVCSNCGNVSATFENYYALSLEIQNQKNIYDALERFIAGNPVSGYLCNECNKRCDVVKRTLISTLPNVLIVHLQRFTYNFDLLANEKIHSRFEFPNVLDMAPYTEEGIEQREEAETQNKIKKIDEDKQKQPGKEVKKMSESEEQERKLKGDKEPVKKKVTKKKELKPKTYYTYKLVGVVVHNGNAEAGHYYSYINVLRQDCESTADYLKTENDRWVEFNDSHISEFAFSRLEAECFGGAQEESGAALMEEIGEAAKFVTGRSKSAYMLVYEKQQKMPIPQKAPDLMQLESDVVLSSLEFDGSTLPKPEKPEGRLLYKDSANAYYYLYNFYNLPLSIPEHLEAEAKKDNEAFLFEKLTYNKEFTKFMCDYISNSYKWLNSSETVSKELAPTLCNVCTKFFIDILPHAKLNSVSSLNLFADTMAKLYSTSVFASREFIAKFVKDPNMTMELLVKCPEVMVRQYVAKALVKAFLCLFDSESELFEKKVESDQKALIYTATLSRDFLDICIRFIGYELATQWTKFKQFFDMLKDIVAGGKEKIINYCFEKDLIAILLDFFLGNLSPLHTPQTKRYEMGSQAQEPDFSYLIELASLLVQRADIHQEEQMVTDQTTSVITYKLSANAIKCLSSDEILTKHIKYNGKSEHISPLIAQMCYNNKDYSKKICTAILKSVNDFDLTKAVQCFGLLEGFFNIKDMYQDQRIEWILGYFQPVQKVEFGLAAVFDISDEVNTYVSPIGAPRKDDPLLYQIWKHRRRIEQFTILGIKLLLQLMGRCEPLHKYLKTVPAPAYTDSNYIAWMCNYINAEAESIGKSPVTLDKKEKDAKIAETLDLVHKYLKETNEECMKTSNLYMIGKILHYHDYKGKMQVPKTLKLIATEIVTEVYSSVPIGEKNLALDADYLIKHHDFDNGRKRTKKAKRKVVVIKPAEKEGEIKSEKDSAKKEEKKSNAMVDAQEVIIINDTEMKSVDKNSTESNAKMEDIVPENKENKEKQGDKESKEKQEDKENKEIKEDKERKEKHENKENKEIKEELVKAEIKKDEMKKEASKDEMKKEAKKEEIKKEAKAEMKEENKNAVKEEKVVQNEFRSLITVMKLEISSGAQFDGYATVLINSKDKENLNFFLPRTKLKVRIVGTGTTLVHYFIKMNPEQGWGDFEIEVKTKEKAKKDVPMKDVSKNPIANIPVSGPIMPVVNADFGSSASIKGPKPEISCPTCTLLNPADALMCSVCGCSLSLVGGHNQFQI